MLYKNFSLFFPAITSTNHGLEIMNLGRLYEPYDFFSREARFCVRERHNCDFVRGTGVPLSERKKKPCSRFGFFRPVFS